MPHGGAASKVLSNLPDRGAYDGIRAQIRDLNTENIAALAVRARELEDVIPLWYGEGDLVTPAFIREAAKRSLDEGNTFYIPNMRGADPLSEALSTYQTRLHGVDIAKDRSTVTPSGMQAVFLALDLIVDAGTNVIIIEPQWPNIASAVHIIGGEARAVPLRLDGDWRLDLDRLFARCDARTRAIMFSSPGNPTGWVATEQELQALLDFSRRTGIWIIADEVYSRLYFEGKAAPSMLAIASADDRVMTINSFSKAWAMTGWRIGWLTHPSAVAPQVAAMTQYINSGSAGFVQAGAHAAITEGEDFILEVKARLQGGLDLAYERLQNVPGIILPQKPRGGMYAFFSIEGTTDARELCTKILEDARVGLAPGSMFGESARPYMRMCIFRDNAQIARALDRMVAALDERGPQALIRPRLAGPPSPASAGEGERSVILYTQIIPRESFSRSCRRSRAG